ncbi:MAG: ROK family protein [Elusimicrobia bacterium]|nr:ROK family protein [Elusimicrobiota bacterium]
MSAPRTLAVDIGGSGIKVLIFNSHGQAIGQRLRVATPRPATPKAVLAALKGLVGAAGDFERVSVGFPGVVRNGVVYTAVNLHPAWVGFDMAKAAQKLTGKPARVGNDADVQGLGACKGKGVELTVTLGTGFGSGLCVDGTLVPNLELGHAPFRKGQTYEEQLGAAALKKIGRKRWNRRVKKAIKTLSTAFNYDVLYVGGGNAKKLKLKLPPNVRIVPNSDGLTGGLRLWETPSAPRLPSPAKR